MNYYFVFFSSFFLNFLIIFFMRRFSLFQPQRGITDNKDIVPTFGGVAMILVFNSLFFNDIAIFLLANAFALIGFVDDYYKVTSKSSDGGLFIKTRLAIEIASAIIFSYFLILNDPSRGYIPFIGACYSYIACLWGALVIISASNSFNLTDGVDSLASTLGIFALLFIAIKTSDPVAINLIFIIMGFLFWNIPPAKIYMGDTGALSLGAIIGALFYKYNYELILILVGFGFVLETATTIIQIASFKLTKKRVFLMTPFHHHLQKKGYSKNQILLFFNFIALVGFALALYFY